MDSVGVNFRALYSSQGGVNGTYRSQNAIVAQSKNCPFGFNNTTELKNITTPSDENYTWWGMLQLKSMPVLLGVVTIFWNSIVLLTPPVTIFGLCHYCIQ